MSQRYEYELFADYFQFYLQDESSAGDLSNSWTPEAVARLLAVAPGAIGVGTVRNMNVPVVVEIADSEPPLDLDSWDQVNECSIDVQSGRIVVAGCTDYFPDAARISVVPGSYCARIHYENLSSASADGLEGNDKYNIVLWLAPPRPFSILKARSVTDPNI